MCLLWSEWQRAGTVSSLGTSVVPDGPVATALLLPSGLGSLWRAGVSLVGRSLATWCLKMFLSTFLCKQSPNVFFGQP